SSIGDAVLSTDVEGCIVFANPVAASLLGRAEEEVIDRHLDDVFRIVNEYTRATVESPVAKVMREGAIVGMANHTVLLREDGTEVPIDDSAAPILDADGRLRGTVLVFRDVTARRKADATERLLAAIVESTGDAIVSKDLNGIVTSWNRGAERIFGYTVEEMIGRPIAMLAAPGHEDEMPSIMERIRSGEGVTYQTVRRRKDGDIIDIDLTVSPVLDGSGRVIGASKIARDVTERKRADERLRESERKTREAHERLRTTLASIGDAVIVTDVDGRITLLNRVAENLTGWTAAESLGAPLEKVFVITNEHTGAPVENPVAKVLREGEIVGLANHTVLTTQAGLKIPIDDSAAPIPDEQGRTSGVVLVFRDVTERKKAETALLRTNEDLRQFAFAASHDLQEPLMRQLLRDLLAYTQIEAAQEDRTEHVDLNRVLAVATENLQASIRNSGAVVTSDPLPVLPGHESRFLQLFQNLIENAIKYHGQDAPRVHIGAQQTPDGWRIGVADNGIGIDPQYHQQIFGVFRRLHGKNIPGTGIGLAICQRVVERYGGRIWVDSEAGRGATFYFTLRATAEGEGAGA